MCRGLASIVKAQKDSDKCLLSDSYKRKKMPDNDKSPLLIDIREDDLLAFSAPVLDTLLRDHTTGQNIFWATHDYEALGAEYDYHAPIQPALITGEGGMVIRPRVLKSKEAQSDRVKDMAEVFTPSCVVKRMVDYVDIDVTTLCMELTCGEAPFLVSRYDATTGAPIAIGERVGVLDRKLQLVNSQQLSDEEWLAGARKAFQSTYGYEWQGDSLLLARENLLYTFADYYEARFGTAPEVMLLQEFAEIISWNLWQMDGLTYRIPQEKKDEPPQAQLSFFDEAPATAPTPLCIIKDWQKGEAIKVIETKNRNNMKFDVIIGNPPYQEETSSDSTRKPPIFNFFMDEAYKCADKVELITPARFLFNAGYTSSQWNSKMLNDPHLKVQMYEAISGKIFQNTLIEGGIVVTYHDNNENFGAIETFVKFAELNTILRKVKAKTDHFLNEIISSPLSYQLTPLVNKDYPDLLPRLRSSAFSTHAALFVNEVPNDRNEYIGMMGLSDNERTIKYIRKDYIRDSSGTLDKWNVLVSKANGASGTLGNEAARMISRPSVIGKGVGYTQTFIAIGKFDTQDEARNAEKYVLSKFARAMLGILKITQDCPGPKWAYVPLQDFTPSSDIDWSKSIAEIDEQLFDKYGLDEQEKNFIRTKVKEMV